MQLNLFQNILNEVSKININEFINEIIERLEKMEQELVIDRFEGNIVVCEDRKTKEKIEILKQDIDEGLKEGDIIKQEKGKYIKRFSGWTQSNISVVRLRNNASAALSNATTISNNGTAITTPKMPFQKTLFFLPCVL